jgi:peroxiredoxin
MDKEQLNWRSFGDRGAIHAKWNAGTPAYYVIDASGVIRYKWVGGNPGEKAIDAAIEKVLN